MKKAALHNLGCKVNAYETEAMQEMLEKAGYEIVPFKEGADVYIINTCTVTNMADRKSRQMLHKARKMNPDAIVVAAGCYVQAQKEDEAVDPAIDIVIGNNKKKDLIEILNEYEREHKSGELSEDEPLMEVIDINHTNEYEELELSTTTEHTRAYIKVQDGCNQFCSYCIIPYARGRVRSRDIHEVVAEVKRLVNEGYKEVVLTGIHLSSYGVDLDKDVDLLALIEAVNMVDGLKRIRLGSLEPRIVTEEFAKRISEMPKMCPHFHLSMQSGCDETLKRMNRRYTSGEFYEKCELLRKYFDNPALTTDVIVGFPGETEEEFNKSMAFVDKVGFYETHVFKYSRRHGTRADKMPNQVRDEIKTKRSDKLIALNEKHMAKFEKEYCNRDVEILVEEDAVVNGRKVQVGHTKEYIKIALVSDKNLKNQIVKVHIPEDSEFFIEI